MDIHMNPDGNLAVWNNGTLEKTLTLEDFEREVRGRVSPAMYDWMTLHIVENAQENGGYSDGMIEEAVFDYSNLIWSEKSEIHREKLAELRSAIEFWEEMYDSTLEAVQEFPIGSPVVRGLDASLEDSEKTLDRLRDKLAEEEEWRGGWEDGESQTDGPRYDEMDET